MRYDTKAALHELQVRSKAIRRRRERSVTFGLSMAIVSLGVALVLSTVVLTPCPHAATSLSAYGAYLLPGEAGGYVLAGVTAFVAGVGVTLACMRAKTKCREKRLYGGAPQGVSIDDVEKDHDHV